MTTELKNHRIIITGACGVVGTALSNRLVSQGASVIGFARRASKELACPLITGDLLDKSFLMKAFKDVQSQGPVTEVFHLAGLADANLCDVDPFLAFQMNTTMTLHILEAMQKNGIQRLIFPSSAYVYGTNYQEDIKENSNVQLPGVYATTKLTAELMIRSCSEHTKLNGDILRIANIYGPQSNPSTVIGSLLAQTAKGDKIVLQNLSPIRDFIYIDDVIEAFVRLVLSKKEGCNLYNLSMGRGVSVGELAELFCEIKGIAPEMIQSLSHTGPKASRLVLDNQAIFQRLQWRPQIDIKKGLKRTLEIKYGVSKNAKA